MPAGLSIFKTMSVQAALEHHRGGVEFERETLVWFAAFYYPLFMQRVRDDEHKVQETYVDMGKEWISYFWHIYPHKKNLRIHTNFGVNVV